MTDLQPLPQTLRSLPPAVVVTGHYGVGKTNFSLNLAIDMARCGLAVTLVDLDIVNPYFRSSDYPDMLCCAGVNLIAPEFARTALDTPSLSGRIDAAIDEARNEPNRMIIFDAGGDDVGATALGRFSAGIGGSDYAMLYVVNAFREQIVDPAEAMALLPDIERQSRLHASAVVNNSHLKNETTAEHLAEGRDYAHRVACGLNLPLACTTVPYSSAHLVHSVKSPTLVCDSDYFVQVYVKTPWDEI